LPAVHGDPFDRLLVAQSLAEPMTLLTHDRTLAGYGATVRVV
ncbi:MAG: type II toxin-antitoxin system VapC family toxin, partial [Burkholderiales bacterium]|nr:type II toxin-antitoxin system VapC family toxin [Burkholderiales bacterium]